MSDTQHPDERVVFDPQNQPTPKDIASREFQAIWNVIKHWDIQRSPGVGYAGANGSDVMRILNALNGQESADDR